MTRHITVELSPRLGTETSPSPRPAAARANTPAWGRLHPVLLCEHAKSLVVGTFLERLALCARRAGREHHIRRHPELTDYLRDEDYCASVMQHLIGSESNCVDVGAHLGATISSLLRLAPQGNHVAFEPTPRKAQWLREKFWNDPRVTILQRAVAGKAGSVRFYDDQRRSGFSGLMPPPRDAGEAVEIEVECVTLDEALCGRRVDFLKVDVEGAELQVLRGAREVLQRCRPVVMFECMRNPLRVHGVDPVEIYGLLADAGYEIYRSGDLARGREPVRLGEFIDGMQYPFKSLNYFALPVG